jgi:hypothetical protein
VHPISLMDQPAKLMFSDTGWDVANIGTIS